MSETASEKRRLPWIRRLGGLAILAIAGFVAYLVGSHNVPSATSSETWPIVAVPSTLNFGAAWETDSFHWAVEFENVSDKTAVLEDCRSGCACVRIEAAKNQVLEPGQRATIALVVDLRQIRMNDESEYRPVELSFVNSVANRGEPSVQYRWQLRGRVRRAFACDPPQFRLGEVLADNGIKTQYNVDVRPYVPNIRIIVKNASSVLSTKLEKMSIGYKLRITSKRKMAGRFHDKIDLLARDINGRVLSVQQLTLEGTVTSTINVFPNDADFGVLPVGDIGAVTVSVCSTGDGRIEKVEVLGLENHTSIRAVCQEGRNWRFEFERNIDATGPGFATATFRVRTGANQLLLPFQFRWYGIENGKN